MSTAPARNGNLQSLQILRAVAATSVVYCHIDVNPDFGTFGVDIFFVLSGFVMAMVIAGGQRPWDFAASRIARIVPLYWLLTTGVLALAAWKPALFNSTTANLPNYLKSLFFVPYFKENGELHPMLAVGWTLNYEMFFYGCILVAIGLSRRFYLGITLALLLLAYAVGSAAPVGREAGTFLANTLIFEFAFGMLAFHLRERGWVPATSAPVSLALILAAYVLMAVCEVRGWADLRWLVFGLPSVLILLAAVNLEPSRLLQGRWLAAVLAKVGDASYATYLSHAFVVSALRKIVDEKLHLFDPYTPWGVVLLIGIALAVGQGLYILFDRPLSRWCRRLLIPPVAKQATRPAGEPPQRPVDLAPGRTAWVDYAKGIGIVLVVFGHVLRGLHAAKLPMDEALFQRVDSVLYSFHMPLFFFLAGLFFFDSLSRRGARGLLANKLDTIVYPYLVWSLLQGSFEVVLSQWTNGKTGWDDVLRLWEPRAQFWFLGALFLTVLLGTLFYGRLKRHELSYILPSAVLMYALAGNLVHPSVFDQTMTYFVFFALGVAAPPLLQRIVDRAALAAPLSLAVFAGLAWHFHAVAGRRYTDLGLEAGALALAGIALVVTCSQWLAGGRWTLLRRLGEASMVIYLVHILVGSGARIALGRLAHVDSVALHLLVGTAVGLAAPLLLHLAIRRWPLLGGLFEPPGWLSMQRFAPALPLRAKAA